MEKDVLGFSFQSSAPRVLRICLKPIKLVIWENLGTLTSLGLDTPPCKMREVVITFFKKKWHVFVWGPMIRLWSGSDTT